MSDNVRQGHLTLKEAALYTRVPAGTLRKKVRLSEIPAFKPGRSLLFRVVDLDTWITRHKVKTPNLNLRHGG